jgi:lysophospholipase L1-like esterase
MYKLLFLCLAIALLYAAYATYIFLGNVAVGKQLAREAVAYNQSPTSPSRRILIVGDSTAVGVGATTSTLSVAGRLGQEYPKLYIENRGVSGLKISQLLAQTNPISNEKHYLTIIHIGGNDIVQFTSLNDIKRDFPLVLEKYKQQSEHVVVITSGDIGFAPIFRWPANLVMSHRTKRVLTVINGIAAQKNIPTVKLLASRAEDPFLKNPEQTYAQDKFHPGAAGYAIWYEKIKQTLQERAISLE